ncbi:MAG: HlyD family efflux transporter periplasmic adaptor subunit [Polyangia bacterium]
MRQSRRADAGPARGASGRLHRVGARIPARVLWALVLACAAPACERKAPPPAPSRPAIAEPGRVTLTPQAEERLGIAAGLAPVERRRLPERHLFAGEVVPMPGRAVQVAAPLAGVVLADETGQLPRAGAPVKAGQLLLALAPLLGLGERAQAATLLSEAEAQVARTAAQEQAAALALQRAERLVRDGLSGARLLEEAQAQHATAAAAHRAARAQQSTLSGRSAQPGLLGATRILAPIDGAVRDVRVAVRQQVTAGAVLLELVGRDGLWLRVPVSSSEIARLDPGQAARVGALGAEPTDALLDAPPVQPAPETAQPALGTVDVYYALPAAARFRIGQRLAAWLARSSAEDSLVVPAAALLYGTAGEAWLYERTGPQTFARRRVEVLRIDGALAVLRRGAAGLAPSARVVTAGAHELYGAELGVGK